MSAKSFSTRVLGVLHLISWLAFAWVYIEHVDQVLSFSV